MPQGFTPGAPATSTLGSSQPIRDNFAALVSAHAGPTAPGYSVEGMLWYDSAVQRYYKNVPRGTKAYLSITMGAVIYLFMTMRANGLDGSTVAKDVRVRDLTLLATERDWTNSPAQKFYFSSNRTPSYFAAKKWDDPLVNDPVLFTADNILLGKNWEAFAPGTHETVFATGHLQNEANFQSTVLRQIEIEGDGIWYETTVYHWSPGADHGGLVIPGLRWLDIQESGGSMILLEDGVERDPVTYAIRPVYNNPTVSLVVYNINPQINDLAPFNPGSRFTLRIRKPS